jgi:ketosteroid isomerase-like protein
MGMTSKVVQRRANIECLDQMMTMLSRGDLDGAFEMWADDGALEMPWFPDPEHRCIAPTSSVRELFRRLNEESFRRLTLTLGTVYPLLDPDALLAEYTGEATVRANGNTYRNEFVGLFRFRDGQIVVWRAYMDALQSLYWRDQSAADLIRRRQSA